MTDTPVLLCRRAASRLGAARPARSMIVDGLCQRPSSAARAVRQLGASAVVLGLCDGRAPAELLAALRRAGVEPFAIVEVTLGSRPAPEAAALLDGAVARLETRIPGERGRAQPTEYRVSRRALFSLAAVVEDAPVAIVDRATCLGTSRCGLCGDACPQSAIDVGLALAEIDASRCSACGSCITACPVSALHLTGALPQQIEAQLSHALTAVSRVVFACATLKTVVPAGSALIELPGLGILTAGWIVQARRHGAEVILLGCGGRCCEGADATERLASQILAAELPIAPRSPLGVLKHAADRCTLCGACSAACPTGALTSEHTPAADLLIHDPSVCAGCPLCVRACPEDALDLRHGLDVEGLRGGRVELMHTAVDRCSRCAEELPPLPTRRRVAALIGRPDAPVDLCARCATEYARASR